MVLELNSLSFHSRLLCRWFWFTEFSCITKSSTNRDYPLKSFCCVPNYIISVISFLLLYNNGQRIFSRSGLHAQKQLYFSFTRIIPNSPNANMRCQLSHIICRLYSYSHTLSDTSKFFSVLFFFFFFEILCITSRPSASSFFSFFFFFKCIWVTLPQLKSKHCLHAVPTVVIKRQQILWNLSYTRVWGELNLETVRTTTALNCWTTSPAPCVLSLN